MPYTMNSTIVFSGAPPDCVPGPRGASERGAAERGAAGWGRAERGRAERGRARPAIATQLQ